MTEPAATVKTVPFDPEAKPGTTVNQNNHATNVDIDPTKVVIKDGKTQAELDHEAAMIKKAADGTNTASTQDDDLFAGKYKTKEEFDKAILSAYHKKHGDKVEDAFKQLTGDLSNSNADAKTPEEIAAEKVIADKAAADAAAAAGDTRTDAQKAADAAKEKADAEAAGDTRTDAQKAADAAKEKADADANVNTDNDDGNVNIDFSNDIGNFVQEFNKDGKLSDDSYGKLNEAGFDRQMVDTYMSGVATQRDSLFEIVGGKENFFQMTEWAAEDGGMSEKDITLFNEDLNTGEPAKMTRAVNTLKTAFATAGQKVAPGKSVQPANVNAETGVSGYTHIDELKADQRDPRYKTSAAFRATVKEKIRLGKV